jgi:hypothetical protein
MGISNAAPSAPGRQAPIERAASDSETGLI